MRAEMIKSPVVVLLLVLAIANNRWAFGGRVKEDECDFAGLSGSTKIYLAQNCRPQKCLPTASTPGFTCSIGNYKDQMPGACKEVERMLMARQSSPHLSVEKTCQPLLTALELYDYKCREVKSLLEKALRFAFILPLCNEDSIKSSQGVKVDFNADNKSLGNYYVSHQICRTFNYSGSNFTLWTNRSHPIELEDDCMAIGLQDGYPDVLYYLCFTEFPSGVQVNYTVMFKDVKEESMRLLAGAWLTRQRAHFIFMRIKGIKNYTIDMKSGSKGWTFSKKISSPSVIITDIPNSSSTITVTVTPSDKKACEEQNYRCSPITLTLMDKNSLNLPIESSDSPHEEGVTKWGWKHSVIIALGTMVAAALVVIAVVIYRRRRCSGHRYRPGPVLWIADSPQSSHVEDSLRKRGVLLTHALQEDTRAVEQMRNHDIIILLLPSALSIPRPYLKMVQTVLETKPLWKKLRVISYAEEGHEHLLPSSILQNQFRNHSHRLEFLGYLDNHVYRLPEDERILVENLTEHHQRRAVKFHRGDEEFMESRGGEDLETMSLVSESVLSDSFSYVSESSEKSECREVRRARHQVPPSHKAFEQYFQAVPEVDEEGSDGDPEQSPSSEVSSHSMSGAFQSVGECDDPEEHLPLREHQETGDSHETHRKQPVDHQDVSELLTESDSLLRAFEDLSETFPKELVDVNHDIIGPEEESCPAVPREEDTEREQIGDESLPEVSDQTQSLQERVCEERNGDSPPLNDDPSSSDSIGPSGLQDLAIDLRSESIPLSSEQEEDRQESNASSQRVESALKPQPSDSKPENTDASQRSGTSSMESRGRFDHDPQNRQYDLDHIGSQCRPSASATPTDDSVKSEESVSGEGTSHDNSYGEDSGGRVDGAHGCPPAEKESNEMQDVSLSGFVPRGPPPLLNPFPHNFPRAGSGDSGGNLSAGSLPKNQHAESSVPAGKGGSAGQLSRMLLDLQGQGHREGLVDRHPRPCAEFDNCGDPDYVGEMDERGERYFEPAFGEHEQPGSVDVSPQRLPFGSSADLPRQPPVGAPDEPQRAFHPEPPGDRAGQSCPSLSQHLSASCNGLPSAVDGRHSSGLSSGHSPDARPSGNFQPADSSQHAAMDFGLSPASDLQQRAADAHHRPADALEHHPPGDPAHHPQGDPAQHHPQGDPAQHHPQGDPAQQHPQGDPAQHHPQGDPAQHHPQGDPLAQLPNGAAPLPNAVAGQYGDRRHPVEHEWPPESIRNDSGCYSLEE